VEIADSMVGGFGGMPQGITESTVPATDGAPLMFTGIQILEPRIFDYIPRGIFSHSTTDVYPQAIARGERIAAHVTKGKWYELSTITRYLEVSLRLLAEQGARLYTGARSQIAAGAKVDNSIIWDDVTIEPGAQVNRAVLADGVRIPAGEAIENAAVVHASLVRDSVPPAKALKGELRGENFVVPLAQ